MKPLTFFILLLLAAAGAFAQRNLGGLYFCPETKDLFYVGWDAVQAQVNKAFWRTAGQKPRNIHISDQHLSKEQETLAEAYYLYIGEEERPAALYQCSFFESVHRGRNRMLLQAEGSASKHTFLQIDDVNTSSMDPSLLPHQAMITMLSNFEFHLYDAATRTFNPEITISSWVRANAEAFELTLTLPEDDIRKKVVISLHCTFDQDFNLHFGIGPADRSRSAHRVKFEILDDHSLALHFDAINGERIVSIAERNFAGY